MCQTDRKAPSIGYASKFATVDSGSIFYNSMGTSAPDSIRGADKPGQPFPGNVDEWRMIAGPPDSRMEFSRFSKGVYELADTRQVFRERPKFVAFAQSYAVTG
jgi:hypothetical protein